MCKYTQYLYFDNLEFNIFNATVFIVLLSCTRVLCRLKNFTCSHSAKVKPAGISEILSAPTLHISNPHLQTCNPYLHTLNQSLELVFLQPNCKKLTAFRSGMVEKIVWSFGFCIILKIWPNFGLIHRYHFLEVIHSIFLNVHLHKHTFLPDSWNYLDLTSQTQCMKRINTWGAGTIHVNNVSYVN